MGCFHVTLHSSDGGQVADDLSYRKIPIFCIVYGCYVALTEKNKSVFLEFQRWSFTKVYVSANNGVKRGFQPYVCSREVLSSLLIL